MDKTFIKKGSLVGLKCSISFLTSLPSIYQTYKMRKETLERCIRLLEEVKYDIPTITKYNNIDYVLEVLRHEQVSNQHRNRTLTLMKKRINDEEEIKRQNDKERRK